VTAALDSDPAVPQRDLLLDPDVVAERLSRLLGLRVDSCRQLRVKYRIGARLRLVHRLRVGPDSVDVTSSTFPTLARSRRAYAQARVVAGRQVVHDAELATVFWTFPNDRKLAHLAAVVEPATKLAALSPGWSRSELISYAPEKSATVRCLDAAGRTVAFAKTYAGDEGERAYRVHAALTGALEPDDPHLRLPEARAYSPAHRTLVVEAVEGTPPRTAGEYRRLGRALARLHELAPPDDVRFRRAEPDRLEAAAGLIASVRSDVAAPVRRLALDIAEQLDPGAAAVCLHGDVNFRNALVANGRSALIDLDQVAAGPAAAELGSVLASLRYAGLVGLIRPRLAPDLCAAVLAGYSELRDLPEAPALRAHTAAALLGERSLRVVTRVRPEGLRRLPALLGEAREALASR
jgi:aminoglycoside phosphotransferase (APT) family kinase protein